MAQRAHQQRSGRRLSLRVAANLGHASDLAADLTAAARVAADFEAAKDVGPASKQTPGKMSPSSAISGQLITALRTSQSKSSSKSPHFRHQKWEKETSDSSNYKLNSRSVSSPIWKLPRLRGTLHSKRLAPCRAHSWQPPPRDVETRCTSYNPASRHRQWGDTLRARCASPTLWALFR
jgi:hypothetical protein